MHQHRIIQTLAVKVFKMKNELSPILGRMLNNRINSYNLGDFQKFATEIKKSQQLVWSGNVQFLLKTVQC